MLILKTTNQPTDCMVQWEITSACSVTSDYNEQTEREGKINTELTARLPKKRQIHAW